ncbi:MAG: capsular polysaccharide biosynthesis protein [Rhodobacteraceae bacterium]|nr:capsular polysaccharide biosynthesis protein [Paracoccaceae bacterium]
MSGWRLIDARWTNDLNAICGWALRPSTERPRLRSEREGLPYIALEDGFLRSLDLGLRGEPPLSLLIDDVGVHYAAAEPSALERLLASDGWETPELTARAGTGIKRLIESRVSKYNIAPDLPTSGGPDLPPPGYVLVLDQTRGDASITYGGATPDSFAQMLAAARDENPGARILVKTHPDVVAGLKRGHFHPSSLNGAELCGLDVSPWTLVDGAEKVYAVTSQMGFEALLAGKPVRLFGAPFYAGWGVTEDSGPADLYAVRRTRHRSVTELFAAAYLLYPTYYDPFTDQLTDFETTLEHLALRRRREAENSARAHCVGVTLWKQGVARRFLGSARRAPVFHRTAEAAVRAAAEEPGGGRVVAWSSRVADEAAELSETANAPFYRMEDGFLRSVGLGQALRLPASLAIDAAGVYYDPRRPSDLERLIAADDYTPDELTRAAKLRARIVDQALTKYMLPDAAATAPCVVATQGRTPVLVVGQVEDDASILTGTTNLRTNADLLAAARAALPEAWLIYKPHPDVAAGYRHGALLSEVEMLADQILSDAPAPALIDAVEEVWTLTSLMGFEALIRAKRVVCCGWPFYAGWGLTEDRAAPPPPLPGAESLASRRLGARTAPPDIDILVAAAYLRYPRYLDPITGLPCEAETILDRLAARDPRTGRHPNPMIRAFASVRAGVFAVLGPSVRAKKGG